MSALMSGKNVFCEKPLGLTIEQIETIQKEASREDAPYLMVGFNRRFAPLAQKMKTFIEKSTEPKLVHYRVNAGFIPANHWTQDAAQGGGRIIGEGCHFIDFVAHMIGAKMTSIQTVGLEDGTRYHEDNVHITMEFEDGSIGLVTYLANGDKAFAKERVEIFTGGRIAVLNDYRSLELVANGSRKVEKSRLRQDKGHAAEWVAFAQAIATGSPPPITLDDLITVSKASILAVESLRDGEKKIL
jgi:predicted dehydrogenase